MSRGDCRITRDGVAIYRGERIGRIRKQGRRWAAEHHPGDLWPWQMPETFARQCDAYLALAEYHRNWELT